MKVKCLCGKKVGVMKFLYYLYNEKKIMCNEKFIFIFWKKVFVFFLKVF